MLTYTIILNIVFYIINCFNTKFIEFIRFNDGIEQRRRSVYEFQLFRF